MKLVTDNTKLSEPMKRKSIFLFLPVMVLAFMSLYSCTDVLENKATDEAADLVVDNDAVTLVQGDEITVNITSGNGDYFTRSFDESVVTASVSGTEVTIKAVENSSLGEDDVLGTTVIVVDGRKKVVRINVQVARLWDLTTDVAESGLDLFIGETRTVKILTGNGDYKISAAEGYENHIGVSEITGQTFTVTGLLETAEDIMLTLTDKKGKSVTFPVKVSIVDLTLDSNEAVFAEPDASAQYITIEQGNGGYSFAYRTGDGEPATASAVVEAVESGNLITLTPKSAGEVTVIVTDQKGSSEEIAVTVNPYELKLADNASSITVEGFANTASVAIARGNGGYRLADLTADNLKYIKSAEIDGNNNIVVEAKWLGTTTLTLSDNAGKTLEIPVTVAPVAAELSSDYCFRMGIREYIESHPDFDHQEKLTFEMVFWPTYSRSLQSFIGLEGVFLLRCEGNGDTDLRFEIATNIHKDPYNLSGDVYNDPRFRSRQRMGNDRQGNAQWYHIAIVFDGTQSSTKEAYKMYINGVREELTPASDEYADVAPDPYLVLSAVKGDEALMIGRSGNSEYRLGYCAVAQARMWTVARTEAEIKADMCTYFSPEEAAEKEGLAGYWVPSEGTSGIDAFPNYGYVGEGLDGIVYNNAVKTITETPFTGKYRLVDCPYLVR